MNSFIKGFKIGFNFFKENISIIINSILLSIIYIIGIGLSFLIAKILRKGFLDTKIDKNKNSYWLNLNLGKKKEDYYYKQF